jgi:transcriptional regulator of arginine metabolism
VKERTQRLKAIKRIIRGHRINSQETLLNHLVRDGFNVTQATLSRDLKLLKVGKISEGADGYYYSLPSEEERKESEHSYIMDFQRGFVSIDFSGCIGVIRTLPGHAGSVALALDSINFEDILGTIAGDDTVVTVIREGIGPDQMLALLREKFPDLDE